MKKQLLDEQIDGLIRTLVSGSAADEALLDEIADSPATWWGVQRKITERKAATKSPWPPVGKGFRWLKIGFPAATAAALIIFFLIFRQGPIVNNGNVAINESDTTIKQPPPVALTSPEKNTIFPPQPVVNPTRQAKRNIASVRSSRVEKHTFVRGITETRAIAPVKEEIKTDFIALSYARDPESGQIVRVKVPRALMVSLGVVASDKTPSGMVDAEVLVGDDGLTRAIRFIR